jgi:hypothetical protein
VLVTRHLSAVDSLSPIDPAVKQARNRIKVIDEIITTEERYIADLTVACEKIRRPLKQQQVPLDDLKWRLMMCVGCMFVRLMVWISTPYLAIWRKWLKCHVTS